ncbi:MAG: VWA domain-containing protein [bacterium]|nr:VWA domain-containing protein [bacterium]
MILILLLAVPALAQEEPTFRTGVSLVRVDVQVVKGRRIVSDLTKDDFLVLDEGSPQDLVYFGREQDPLSVLLLLDVSGSMRKHVKQMASASRKALAALRPGDRVGIMVFGREAALRWKLSEDLSKVERALKWAVEDEGTGSGTRINAAIAAAADHLRETLADEPGRRSIVVLTDNGSWNYQFPDEKALAGLYRADAVLNAIVVGKAKPPEALPRGDGINPDFTPPNVFRLASDTGGEVVRGKKTGEAFGLMMERIRTRYSLHYRARESAAGGFRRIEVRLTGEAAKRYRKAEVRARRGYYYGEEPVE